MVSLLVLVVATQCAYGIILTVIADDGDEDLVGPLVVIAESELEPIDVNFL